jgi:RimJ/RimL family protein N-acetyltransferase
LYIRPFEERDFEQFKTLLELYPGWKMQSERVRQFFEWHLSNYKKMDIEHGYICFGIFLKDTDRLIGNIGLNEHDDLHVPELGYGISEAFRGKGFAKEAAKAALCWAKSYFDIPFLVGTAEVNHTASRKVLEYCGFELEGIKNLEVHIEKRRSDFATYKYQF